MCIRNTVTTWCSLYLLSLDSFQITLIATLHFECLGWAALRGTLRVGCHSRNDFPSYSVKVYSNFLQIVMPDVEVLLVHFSSIKTYSEALVYCQFGKVMTSFSHIFYCHL